MEPLVDPLQTSKLYYSALTYNYKTRIYGKDKIRIGRGSTPKGKIRIGRGSTPKGKIRIGRGSTPKGKIRIGRGSTPKDIRQSKNKKERKFC
jgi:hypothetical protein